MSRNPVIKNDKTSDGNDGNKVHNWECYRYLCAVAKNVEIERYKTHGRTRAIVNVNVQSLEKPTSFQLYTGNCIATVGHQQNSL